MSNTIFTAIIAILIVGVGVVVFTRNQSEPKAPDLGTQHTSQGQKHLESLGEKHAPYNSDLPSSGPHLLQPAEWGIHEQEVPDEQFIHNLEHGGIVITYKPDLPTDQLNELNKIARNLAVNDSPNAQKGFKVLLAPRGKNTKPIQVAAWRWTLNMDKPDQEKLQTFYRQRLGKAPEPGAQ